jgi:hypothetical protein
VRRIIPVFAAAVLFGGCYHATVNTGVSPGSTQVTEEWAKSFVYGLVPPPTVDAVAACASAGVARVETQHSFLNGLVAGLTFGIFTPMTITVTCGAEDQDLPEATTREEVETALDSGTPFLVRMTP